MAAGPIDPHDAPVASGGYAQAFGVPPGQGLLFISGQIPVDAGGTAPEGFEAQCRQVWANVLTALRAAGLGVGDLAKVTTFLSSRDYAEANSRIRREVLGDHRSGR